MRTIIAGSRTITNYIELLIAIKKIDWEITTIISGGARGADKLGERYAKRHNIPLEIYPANWNLYGKRAGPIRNAQMAEEAKAEALICLWNGKSTGSADMIKRMKGRKTSIHIVGEIMNKFLEVDDETVEIFRDTYRFMVNVEYDLADFYCISTENEVDMVNDGFGIWW